MPLKQEAEMAIRESMTQAIDAKNPMVEAEHLLLSILKNSDDASTKVLGRLNLDFHNVSLQLHQI